jgi:hypothetical protein
MLTPALLIPSNTALMVILWPSAAATLSLHYGTLPTGSANILYQTWLAVSTAYPSVSTAHTSAVLTEWTKTATRASTLLVPKLARLCILSRPPTLSTSSHGIRLDTGWHMLVIWVVLESLVLVAIFDFRPKSFLSKVPSIWFLGLARRCLEFAPEIDTSSSRLVLFCCALLLLLF